MPSFQLSTGCCEHLPLSSYDEDPHWREPVVQFLSVKKVHRRNSERYRLIVSDGKHFIQGMLAIQCNALVESEEIQNFSVAVIEKWTSNTVQNKRLVILLSVRILGHPNEKIGEPQDLYKIIDGAAAEPTSVATASGDPTDMDVQQQPQYHQPQFDNQRGAEDETRLRPLATIPIEDLNPYQNKWTIKARVTQKSDIKAWSNKTGEGKMFSVTLIDKSGEIKATAFNTVADEFFSRLEEGKVYCISKARIKLANKIYSTSDYELTLERDTNVEECHESSDTPILPKFNFVPIDQLEGLKKDVLCDVIGIVKETGDASDITTREGNRTVKKRDIILVDHTSCSVQLTLWGKQAETFSAVQDSVVAFKGVKTGDFGGVSLSANASTLVASEPVIEEGARIRHWYDTQGAKSVFRAKTAVGAGSAPPFSKAEALCLSDIKESGLGMGAASDSFSTQATIVHIREDRLYYPACTSSGCNKKVIMDGETWHCGKCDTRVQVPDHRYNISMVVADWSDKTWLQGWNEVGIAMFGMTANELHAIKLQDEVRYRDIIHQANCRSFNFSCRTKQDTFDDRVRVKYELVRANSIDYHEEACYMLELLCRPQWDQ